MNNQLELPKSSPSFQVAGSILGMRTTCKFATVLLLFDRTGASFNGSHHQGSSFSKITPVVLCNKTQCNSQMFFYKAYDSIQTESCLCSCCEKPRYFTWCLASLDEGKNMNINIHQYETCISVVNYTGKNYNKQIVIVCNQIKLYMQTFNFITLL